MLLGKPVGRDSLQHELAGISVFALITFKRNCKQMDSDEHDHRKDNCQKDPSAQPNALFKSSNTGCHRSTIELARLPPCSALPIALYFLSRKSIFLGSRISILEEQALFSLHYLCGLNCAW